MKASRKIITIMYAVFSLFLCYLLISSIIYSISLMTYNQNGYEASLLSGSELFKKIIKPEFIKEFWFPILALLSIIAVNVLSVLSAFFGKKFKNGELKIIGLIALSCFFFSLSSQTSYLTNIYFLTRTLFDEIWFILFANVFEILFITTSIFFVAIICKALEENGRKRALRLIFTLACTWFVISGVSGIIERTEAFIRYLDMSYANIAAAALLPMARALLQTALALFCLAKLNSKNTNLIKGFAVALGIVGAVCFVALFPSLYNKEIYKGVPIILNLIYLLYSIINSLGCIAVAVNTFKPFITKYRFILGGAIALFGLAQSIIQNVYSAIAVPSAVIINIIPIFILNLIIFIGLFCLYLFAAQKQTHNADKKYDEI